MSIFSFLIIFVTSVFVDAHDDDFGGESFSFNPFRREPEVPESAYFCETFSSKDDFKLRWVVSQAKKGLTSDNIAKYEGQWRIEEPIERILDGDMGLVLKSKAKHHAISSALKRPFSFDGKSFIVQFEVKLQRGLDCGGSYIKLLKHDEDLDLNNFHDETPYVIMFGPDKCGSEMKIHFIFRHKNPITGKYEEKHSAKTSKSLDKIFRDKMTHLYTLVIHPNNSFSIMVDMESVVDGNLLSDMKPSVNPSTEVIDPNDTKPWDWEDREMIPDPEATKPENWDETFGSEFVPDESAKVPEGWMTDEEEWVADDRALKPSDWDEEIDGTWEPPMIPNQACEQAVGCGQWTPPLIRNPIYKGPWSPPIIRNPSYKGLWSPRKIANPNYFFDPLPYNMSSIGAVGIEIWSMSVDIMFDDFLVTDSLEDATSWAARTWKMKNDLEMRRHESSEMNTIEVIVEAANERPWLWVPIILAIVFPTLVFIVCCCGSPPKSDKPSKVKLESSQQNKKFNSLENRTQNNLRQRNSTKTGVGCDESRGFDRISGRQKM